MNLSYPFPEVRCFPADVGGSVRLEMITRTESDLTLLPEEQISVIVPCYNCSEYILKALESFESGFSLLHGFVREKVCAATFDA